MLQCLMACSFTRKNVFIGQGNVVAKISPTSGTFWLLTSEVTAVYDLSSKSLQPFLCSGIT